MLCLSLFGLLGIALGMNRSHFPRRENVSLPESDLDVIPLNIFYHLKQVAEFSNEMVRIMDFPWLVSLQNLDGSHLCSANILTSLYVLTTCQCLTVATGSVITPVTPKRPEDIFVVAGVSRLNLPIRELMSRGQVREVEKIHTHPRCSPRQKFDFAIAELDYFLYFSPFIQPILLPYEQMNPLPRICSTAGWRESLPGWDRPDTYYEDMVVTELIVLKNSECPDGREPQEGAQFVCTSVHPLMIWRYSYDGVWSDEAESSRNPLDHGSGLLCNGKVIAILSHHSKNRLYSMFTSLGPALSFLSPFFMDFEDTSSTAISFHGKIFPFVGLLSLVHQSLLFHAPY